MPKIVVQVMPKQELLDPQGKAVAGALARLGHGHLHEVRIGKRFEIATDREADAETLAEVRRIAESLLANGVIEDVVSIEVAEDLGRAETAPGLPLGAASDAQARANERARPAGRAQANEPSRTNGRAE